MSFKERFAKLIDLKSIITIILIGVLSYLTLNDKVPVEQFMPIVTMILTFYFVKKKEGE